MDTDDQMIGRILSRREVLKLFGAAGAALLVGCTPAASTAALPTSATTSTTATTGLNAEAATAVTLDNPTAQVTAAAANATAEAANTAVAAAPAAVPTCVVRPEATEGPYYVAENLMRADIRADITTGTAQAGTPLTLTFNVSQVSNGSCAALAGTTVEIWHCNAAGGYSDVSDPASTPPAKTGCAARR